uniref:Lysozyme inhibitor LprI N-terminal domain-containing protein n=2 Tax=Pandoraea norimbergensis TaxID=93219 RepID=A0ABM5WLC3_9BURK
MISFAKLFSRRRAGTSFAAFGVMTAVAAAAIVALPATSFAQGLSAVEAAGRTTDQIRVPHVPFDATADRTPSAASSASAAAAAAEDDKPVAYDDKLDMHPDDDDFAGRRAVLERQRAWIDYRFQQAKYECASKFFVNYCVDKARDEQREALKAVRSQRLVLEDAERKARAADRDERLDAKRAQTAAEAPQRAAERAQNVSDYQAKQAEYQQRVTERTGQAPQRAANSEQYNAKQAEQQKKLDEAKATADQKAAERAENVRKYGEKQAEAIERQKKSDERKNQSQSGNTPAQKALPGQ